MQRLAAELGSGFRGLGFWVRSPFGVQGLFEASEWISVERRSSSGLRIVVCNACSGCRFSPIPGTDRVGAGVQGLFLAQYLLPKGSLLPKL